VFPYRSSALELFMREPLIYTGSKSNERDGPALSLDRYRLSRFNSSGAKETPCFEKSKFRTENEVELSRA
jgi:hypothetical protein